MNSIRFIHTGDLHLGSPLQAVGDISEALQKSLMESTSRAITNIVDAALEYNVDFVLMCGDIYDQKARSVTGSRFFAAQMERLAPGSIPVFIIYGNHDPIGKSADFFKLPDNVKVLGAEAVECYEIAAQSGGGRARILGQSYAAPSESKKIHLHYQPPVDNLLNIAMLHTGLNPNSNAYVPCSPEELKSQPGIHYWALGHIHTPTIISAGEPIIAYPGIPQGRDAGETGLKGCFLAEITAPDNAKLHFIPTSPLIWLNQKLSLNLGQPLNSVDDLLDLLLEEGQKIIAGVPKAPCSCSIIDKDFKPEGYVVRWEIGGRNSIHDRLLSGAELEISETLKEALNQHLISEKPYLWTAGVKLRTASPLSDLELLLRQDETIKTLSEIKKRIQEEPQWQEEAIAAMGSIWHKPRGEEDLREDTLPVTAEKFNTLLNDAFNLALEKIVKGRENY